MSEAGRALDALVREFYQVWFRFHPERAIEVGVSGYEGRLPAVDDDDVGALTGWLETAIVELEETDYEGLDGEERIDLRLLFGACHLEHRDLLEADWRHRDPVSFLPTPVIHQLMVFPQAQLRGALESCLAAVPEHLRHARAQLATVPGLVPKLWIDAGVAGARQGIEYLTRLNDQALLRRQCRNPADVRPLADQAGAALADFARFLAQDLGPEAHGEVAAGPVRFARRLTQRHFLPDDVDALERAARAAYEQAGSELDALAAAVVGKPNAAAWLAQLSIRAPLTAAEQLDLARAQCEATRAFVGRSGIATLPEQAELKVMPSPGCVLPRGCAPDYIAPSYGDPRLQGAIYLAALDAGLASRMPAVLTGQCLRRGWAGSHLQMLAAAGGAAAAGLARRLNGSTTLGRGWPLYAEEMLHKAGFPCDQENRLARLIEQRRRALLGLLDVALHLRGLDPGEAMDRLASEPGVSRERAFSDVLELTQRPADALAGVTGWRALWCLRDRVERVEGLSTRQFHDRLLAGGPIALPLVAEQAFGPQAWQAALERLLQ
ncbi:MAG: DUF885 domain-containing protein [Gammaproteobacteria bacterium]|jgi:uncharacterized protein (DUF885 family)|nr:DUF885 domain-containing protein [Gammaproteobacteria bacterium]